MKRFLGHRLLSLCTFPAEVVLTRMKTFTRHLSGLLKLRRVQKDNSNNSHTLIPLSSNNAKPGYVSFFLLPDNLDTESGEVAKDINLIT